MSFSYIGDWNAKVGSQEITKKKQASLALEYKMRQGKEFSQENTLVTAITLFQQHKRRLYTWSSPDGQYQNQIDYTDCSQRWRISIQSAKTNLELTVAQTTNFLLQNTGSNSGVTKSIPL